jgi:hypothetical protein
MNTREVLLNPEHLKRNAIVKHILTMTVPDPEEIDAWVMGLFEQDDPKDDDCLSRRFVVFGPLRECAAAIAGFISREPKPSASKLRLLSRQGEVAEIECRSDDVCF